MTIIRDSQTQVGAKVNAEGQLVTRSIIESELEHASMLGTAFTWDSTELNIDAGDTMLFIKNNSSTPLILDRATVNGSNVICTWEINVGTATTTPSGTVISGKNMNTKFFSDDPDATALSDETAVADGSIIDRIKTPVSSTVHVSLDGIILFKNHYLQINQITESTSGSVVVVGHFANPS
jgi:hypothetical protein